MTPEERQLILDLAAKIAQTPAAAPDPEALDLIRTRIGSRPDALYLMTQTVLVQNMALDHARQEVEQWKRQAQPPAPAAPGSFLGGGGWGSGPATPPPAYNTPPAYNQPAPPPAPSGFSGFLRGAATTAAGVAAGALAFEGVRSLFGGGFGGAEEHARHRGFLEETVVNNYYDRPAGRGFLPADILPGDSVDYDSTDAPVPDDGVS